MRCTLITSFGLTVCGCSPVPDAQTRRLTGSATCTSVWPSVTVASRLTTKSHSDRLASKTWTTRRTGVETRTVWQAGSERRTQVSAVSCSTMVEIDRGCDGGCEFGCLLAAGREGSLSWFWIAEVRRAAILF